MFVFGNSKYRHKHIYAVRAQLLKNKQEKVNEKYKNASSGQFQR